MCLDAGQPCDTLDNSGGPTGPRSIARCLEAYIATLEGDNEGSSVFATTSRYDGCGDELDQSPRRVTIRLHPESTAAGMVMNALTPSHIGLTSTLLIPKCTFSPTQIPTARNELDLFEMQDDSHMPPPGYAPTLPLTAIPLGVAEFLLDTYTKRIIPQYPIYSSDQVAQSFNAVYHRPAAIRTSEPDYRDTYIVSLIMAISLNTSARNKQAHAQSLATGLFKTAVQYAPKMWSNDLVGLQALLLSMQYVFLDPRVANMTIVTGIVSEACIDMALHQDLPEHCELDVQEKELRHRLFWCAWEMEIAVAACTRRPPKIPNSIIGVPLPYDLDDLIMSSVATGMSDQSPNFMAHRIWIYRKMESEIMSVLYRKDFPAEDLAPLSLWIAKVEKDAADWAQEINTTAACSVDQSKKPLWDELKLYGHIGYHYLLVCLFGPCPRLPNRSRHDLLKAFAAAVRVASGYQDQANSAGGQVKYVFHSIYHTFSSAIVFLQGLQICKHDIFDTYTFTEIENSLDSFTTLFSTMAERWPAVSRCAQEFEQLLRPIKDEYTNFIFERAGNFGYDTPAQSGWRNIANEPEKEPFYNAFLDLDIPYDWNVEFGFDTDPSFQLEGAEAIFSSTRAMSHQE